LAQGEEPLEGEAALAERATPESKSERKARLAREKFDDVENNEPTVVHSKSSGPNVAGSEGASAPEPGSVEAANEALEKAER